MDLELAMRGLPEGFAEALHKNGEAMLLWGSMTDRERSMHLRRVAALSRAGEIERYVNSLVGSETGHPPYQL